MSPVKPSNKEEEYFLRKEAEKLKVAAEKARKEMEEAEKRHLKDLHWMRCPKCGMAMKEITFRGVQIDKCFSCGGMYLDDGEFEQLASSEQKGNFLSSLKRIFTGQEEEIH
ncbi:MAG: zf-TFIIB domain-containing protein [Deltaproteobacteria bacterium]|nr:zf-TFIIB domain-containing protein [Deltaproteobacteria bacterium]